MSEEKEEQRTRLKEAVRFAYDLQKLRIQQSNRAGPQAEESNAVLDEKQKEFLATAASKLLALETDAFREMRRVLKDVSIWETWIKDQKGVGFTMGGVLVSSIEIEKCNTVSQLWAWCGLAVRDGEAQRRKKGEKANYNPWLKAKLLNVLGGCLIKANSPWRSFYDNYKTRKGNTRVDKCPVCRGAGIYGPSKTKCYVCDGATKAGPYPWAKSDAHLHQAAVRYMVKMFLQELWIAWRKLEGFDTRAPYAEEYLGRKHHAA